MLQQTGSIRGLWFKIHQFFNITALLLAVAAAALIFARFQWAGRADTAPYYTCECVAVVVIDGLNVWLCWYCRSPDTRSVFGMPHA